MGFKEYQYSRVQLCPIDKNITDIPARIEKAADYNEALKLYGEYASVYHVQSGVLPLHHKHSR